MTHDPLEPYTLMLPVSVTVELRRIANRKGVSVDHVIRRMFEAGSLIQAVNDTPGSSVVVREPHGETVITLIEEPKRWVE